jgi:hypothetical protein
VGRSTGVKVVHQGINFKLNLARLDLDFCLFVRIDRATPEPYLATELVNPEELAATVVLVNGADRLVRSSGVKKNHIVWFQE